MGIIFNSFKVEASQSLNCMIIISIIRIMFFGKFLKSIKEDNELLKNINKQEEFWRVLNQVEQAKEKNQAYRTTNT